MYELDFLRVIAAVFVVVIHLTYKTQHAGENPVQFPEGFTSVVTYGFVGVFLFFLISGFGVVHLIVKPNVDASASNFFFSRVSRLYVAYWVCVTATTLAINIGSTHRRIGLGDYLVNMTMLQGFVFRPLVDPVYWTLQVELIFYGVIWLTLVFGQLRNLTRVLWGWMAACGLVTVVQLLGADVGNKVRIPTGYAPYFVLGATASMCVRGDRRRSVTSLLVVAAVMSLVRVGIDIHNEPDVWTPSITVPGSVVATAAVVVLFLLIVFGVLRFGRPWMATAGLLTYAVYLLHNEIGAILFTEWQAMNRWLLLAVVSALVTAAAWIVAFGIEAPVVPRFRRALERWWERVTASRRPAVEPNEASP